MDDDHTPSPTSSGDRTDGPGRRSKGSAPAEDDGSRGRPATLLVLDARRPPQLTSLPNRRWTRSVARLLAGFLDRRLAQGSSPESNRLLAARAQVLVSPLVRQRYAELWANLVAQARRSPVARSPRSPLNRAAVAACEAQIADVRDMLTSSCPMPARGVAMAGWLLRDGAGPLYDRRLGPEHLAAALRRLVEQLDPVGEWLDAVHGGTG